MSTQGLAGSFPRALLCCSPLQPQPCIHSQKFTKWSSVEAGGHLTGLNLQSHHIEKPTVATETHDLFSGVGLAAPYLSSGHFPQDELANGLVKEQHKLGSKYCTYTVIHVAVKHFAFIV